MNDNYPSSGEVVRNIAGLRMSFRTLAHERKFRIIELDAPFFAGYKYWVVNERGFMWEPAESEDAAWNYLRSAEAQEYQAVE